MAAGCWLAGVVSAAVFVGRVRGAAMRRHGHNTEEELTQSHVCVHEKDEINICFSRDLLALPSFFWPAADSLKAWDFVDGCALVHVHR